MVENPLDIKFKTNWKVTVDDFVELDLKAQLLRGMLRSGFETPLRVQSIAILPTLKRRNIIVTAPSGKGKTSTLAISTLQLIDNDIQACQAVILEPTREAAQQAHKILINVGEYLQASVHVSVEENSLMDDQKILEDGVQVFIGTPERVCDMLKRGFLKTVHVKLLAVDNADELFSKEFEDQIPKIFQFFSQDVQKFLLTTLISSKLQDFIQNFIENPAVILWQTQWYIANREEWKEETIITLLGIIETQKLTIYCNNKRKVEQLAIKLQEKNITAYAIHSEIAMHKTDDIIKHFSTDDCKVLIVTDILRKGCSLPLTPIIINYDLPLRCETYQNRLRKSEIHEFTGTVINFMTPGESKLLRKIEDYFGIQFDEFPANVAGIFE